MRNLSALLSRAALTLTTALALGACGRAEYAMLPRSASYLGTTPVASAPRPAAPVAAVAPPQQMGPKADAPGVSAAPVAASTPVLVAQAAHAAPVAATAPVATVATTPAKLSVVQRIALHKISKKLDKLAAKAPQFRQRSAAAGTTALDSNLRTGLLFLLVGLIVSLFSGISGVFGVVGLILALIGLVFLVLWLLDQA